MTISPAPPTASRLSRLFGRLEAALERQWSFDPADAAFLLRCW